MNWIETTVGEFCPFVYGKSLPKTKRKDGQVPVYGSNGCVDYHTESHVKGPGVIIGRKGSVGAIHFSEEPFWPIDTAFYIEKDSLEGLRFTYYLLKSLRLESMNSDSAVPGLNRDNAHVLPIRVPKEKEDREAIGYWLSLYDKKIELNRQTNQTLEQIAQAIFKSWFVDFEPTRAKIAARQTGQDPERAAMAAISGKLLGELDQLSPEQQAHLKATAALFPDALVDSELGEIPAGWKAKVLGDLVTPKRGKTITKKRCVEGNIPVVAGGLTPAYYHNTANVQAPVVTISGSGANAGFTRLYSENIWASDCSYISYDQSEMPYMWYLFLTLNQKLIYDMQEGAVQPHIYPSNLMRLKLAYPADNHLWLRLNSIITPVFEYIGVAESEAHLLANIRDALLPKLLSGKLSITANQTKLERESKK